MFQQVSKHSEITEKSMSLIFQVLLSYAVADGGVPVTLARTGEMGATCANVINAYSASSVTPDAVVPAPPLFDARWTLRVVESVPAHACTAVAAPPAGGNDFALIALRGNCTFSQKMAIARAAGARALVVANTLATMYSAPSNGSATATPWPPLAVPKLTNPCSVDCALARGVATNVNTSIVARGWDCSGFSGCASKICAATGAGTIGAGYEYCCLLDVPALGTIASASAATDPIVLFVGVGDGAALISDARAQRSRIIFLAGSNVSKINPSSYMIWLLGVFTVVCAAWRAAGVERRAMLLRSSYKRVDGKPSRRRVRGVGDDTDDAEEEEDAGEEEEGAEEAGVESVSITIYHAFAMIVMSAVLLLVLFFFITAGYLFVVTIVVIVFCIGSWQAMTEVYFAPPLRLIPWIRTRGVDTICGDFTLASLIAAPISLAIVVAWFAFRNTWSLAWVVQDAMSFALACTFLETIRFNSIKIATVLLSLFFVYDIIMVFITPFIFSSSVMLTVATGGGPRATLSGGTCIHTQGETLPLLYKVPRIGGCTPGQYAMLGTSLPRALHTQQSHTHSHTRSFLVLLPRRSRRHRRPRPAAHLRAAV